MRIIYNNNVKKQVIKLMSNINHLYKYYVFYYKSSCSWFSALSDVFPTTNFFFSRPETDMKSPRITTQLLDRKHIDNLMTSSGNIYLTFIIVLCFFFQRLNNYSLVTFLCESFYLIEFKTHQFFSLFPIKIYSFNQITRASYTISADCHNFSKLKQFFVPRQHIENLSVLQNNTTFRFSILVYGL